jgi:serine/threonine protein kinase
MAVRVKLRATVVHRMGDTALLDTVSAESYQRTLLEDHAPTPGDAAMPDVGDVIGQQYRLTRRLGAGMFGSVFVAERTDVPEHRVAMKIIHRAVYGERSVGRELVMLAAATHPNIVELKDHGMTADHVWLTMPLYEGETLAERLSRGTLGLREAYEIFVPIARGLQALHATGLRHQDVKPENIYLASFAGQLHPVLLDLGVAVESSAEFVAGTALFCAPEQLTALAGIGRPTQLNERMDVYCLASTLLYSLVGEERFPGVRAQTPLDIVNAFEAREERPIAPDALPGLTGAPRMLLESAFRRWLTRDPDERSTAADMATELEVLLEQELEEKREVERKQERQRTVLQRVLVACVMLVLASGGVGAYLISKRESIELADDLRKARAAGQASFDKLDTCSAEYDLSQQAVRECSAARGQDEEALTTLQGKHDDVARLLSTTGGTLKTCTDDAKKNQEAWALEKDKLETEQKEQKASCESDKATLEAERDGASDARRTCEAKIDPLTTDLGQCKQELSACKTLGPSTMPTPKPNVGDEYYEP